MRTVDPDLWFRNLRRSSPDTWALQDTDDTLTTRLRRGLEDALEEFWLHCSARRLKLVTPQRASVSGRSWRNKLGVVLSITMMFSTIASYAWHARLRPPLEINLMSWQYPATGEPFPAVALCHNNLVSKRNLEELTHSLAHSGRVSNYSEGVIRHHLLQLAALVMMTVPEPELDYDLVQAMLEPNVTHILYQLSPKCSWFLKRCAWRGSPTECWRLFAMRLTPLGYCCVFNGRYQPEDINRPPKVLDLIGQSHGLIVEFTQDDEDTAYLRRNTNTGIEILIFDGTEYPLLESGVTRLFPAMLNSSMYFSIGIRTYTATDELRHTSEESRGCSFRDVSGPRNINSSYGWCLANCRQLFNNFVCNCVPFMLIPRDDHVVCMPHHLPCLSKHKGSFKFLYPKNSTDPGVGEERQASLFCNVCRPDCSRPVYSAEVSYIPHNFRGKPFLEVGSEGTASSNTSMMYFFYNSNNHEVYLVGLNVPWYEDISTVGCLWVLFVNVPLVVVIELVFHVTVRWCRHVWRRGERRRRWPAHLFTYFRRRTKAHVKDETIIHVQ